MTLTDRDKKILVLIVPLVLLAAYWFLLLAPKRDEAAQVKEQLTQEETKRDEAVSRAAQLEGAKRGFSEDYATVIQLGKALPASVDMPSLMIQLDRAARGTGIEFDKIATGQRQEAPAAPAAGATGAAPGTQPGGNAQAGGQSAQTGAGQATEAANNAAAQSNAQTGQSTGGANATPGAPGAAAPAGGAQGGASGVAGLDTVPLDFEFTGSFFSLSDFFHRLKRFVRVTNDRILVRGRLLTVDAFKFTAGEEFPQLKAEIKATVYLAPRAQGTAAGATPSGPAPAPAGAPGSQTATTPPTPTATATP